MKKTLLLNIAAKFPHALRYSRWQPTSIVVGATNRCNARCIMCGYHSLENNFPEMSTQQLCDMLSQAQALGCRECVLYGGEILLRPDALECCRHAVQLGMRTSVMTNGLLLAAYAEKLYACGVDALAVSFDACGEQCDQIRGVPGMFARIQEGLQEAVRVRRIYGKALTIACTLLAPTIHNGAVFDVIALGKKYQIPVLIQLPTFSPFYFSHVSQQQQQAVWPAASMTEEVAACVAKLVAFKKTNPASLVNSQAALSYISRYFKEPRDAAMPCYIALSGRIWVDAAGSVYACQSMPACGSILTKSLREIVSAPQWSRSIEAMFRKQCPGCSCMYWCNVDAHIPLAWRQLITRGWERLRASARMNA